MLDEKLRDETLVHDDRPKDLPSRRLLCYGTMELGKLPLSTWAELMDFNVSVRYEIRSSHRMVSDQQIAKSTYGEDDKLEPLLCRDDLRREWHQSVEFVCDLRSSPHVPTASYLNGGLKHGTSLKLRASTVNETRSRSLD
jgi:hypothetical protein